MAGDFVSAIISLMFNAPKNDKKYHWTNHVARKMMFYGLSADRVKRVIRSPSRCEKGVAPKTIAVMQPRKIPQSFAAGSRGKPAGRNEEIWVMYQQKSGKKIIITAWRYPGVSPVRDAVPIPVEILEELKSEKVI